jgi:hypothetical protein
VSAISVSSRPAPSESQYSNSVFHGLYPSPAYSHDIANSWLCSLAMRTGFEFLSSGFSSAAQLLDSKSFRPSSGRPSKAKAAT